MRIIPGKYFVKFSTETLNANFLIQSFLFGQYKVKQSEKTYSNRRMFGSLEELRCHAELKAICKSDSPNYTEWIVQKSLQRF